MESATASGKAYVKARRRAGRAIGKGVEKLRKVMRKKPNEGLMGTWKVSVGVLQGEGLKENTAMLIARTDGLSAGKMGHRHEKGAFLITGRAVSRTSST